MHMHISMHMQLLAQSRPHEKPHAWIGTRRQRARGSSRSHAPSVHPAGWHLVLSLGARPAARDPCARARVRRSAMRRRRARTSSSMAPSCLASRVVDVVGDRAYESIRSKRTIALTPVMHAWPGRGWALQAADHEVSRTLATRPAGHVSAVHGIYHRRLVAAVINVGVQV